MKTTKRVRFFCAASALAGVALIATSAWATSWVRTGTVSMVNVKDGANDSAGAPRVVEITFAGGYTGPHCGSSSATVSIPQTGHALWSEWIRIATAAKLSGKSLRIGSNDNTGSCKTHYLRLEN